MKRFLSFFAGTAFSLALMSGVAVASPGDDHSHDAAPQAAAGPAAPWFEAHSDVFEVVGVLGESELSLFVDRFADNAPVLKAKVELESGKTQAVGQFHEDHGDYSFDAKPFQKPGSYPISLTITAGDDIDMLAGNLVVSDGSIGHGHNEFSSRMKGARFWIGGLLGLVAAILFARRLYKRRNAGGSK